jgi:signal transduction histidine kinase
MEIRRRDRRSLVAREEQRKVYLSKVYEAQENERRRLAQELHDDTIQTFLVIAKSAQNLTAANNGAKEEVGRNATYIKDTALQAIEDVRRLTFDLRPSILDDLGLLPALRWLVDRMNKESEIRTRMLISDTKSRLSPQAEITTFRIVQEALHNIKRHSKAKEAVITLEFSADALNMTIQDDGQGFIPPRKLSNLMAKGNLGLIGMQERIESINGKLKIHSKPSKGTLLSIKIPY